MPGVVIAGTGDAARGARLCYHQGMNLASSVLPAACLVALLAGCPGSKGYKRTYAELTAAQVIEKIAQQRAARTAFTAESTMDYWLGKDRVKGTVLVMGTVGKKLRFNALSPAGGDVLADMACDGAQFVYVDKQNNCQLAGPCDRQAIAQLLRVELEPEDFLHLALGTPPVLAGATGTVTWDSAHGHERVALTAPGGTQAIVIDTRAGRWDVVSSEVKDPAGTVVWSVENADFETAPDAASGEHRLPGKTRFKSPQQAADLLVEWGDRTVNPTIDDAKFVVTVPPGLPVCGAKP